MARKGGVPLSKRPAGKVLSVPAIEFQQGQRKLFCFVVEGKQVHEFAAVSRIRRSGLTLLGYQRPEVLSHVAAIRCYLESAGPLLPNALVVAFDDSVRFHASECSAVSG